MAEGMEMEGKKSSLSTFSVVLLRKESKENSLVGIVMKQILEIL